MQLIGQLVGEFDGGPLVELNVRGYGDCGDGELLPLGHRITDEDGLFSLAAGRSDTQLAGGSLRLRLEVFDGRLDLIHTVE